MLPWLPTDFFVRKKMGSSTMFKDEVRLIAVVLFALSLLLNSCESHQPPSHITVAKVFSLAISKDVPALIGASSDTESTVRSIALSTLADIGDERALKQFRRSLSDPDEFCRETAAYGLGMQRDTKARVALKKSLRDESEYVRAAAAWALIEMGFSEDILDERLKAEKDALTKEFLKLNLMLLLSKHHEGYKEAYARRLMISLGPAPSMVNEWVNTSGKAQVIEELTNALEDGNQLRSVRIVAVDALGILRAPEGVEPLLKIVKESDNWHMRVKALAVLEALEDERVVRPLLDILNTSTNLHLRSEIVKTFGNLGDKQAVVPLMEILVAPEYIGNKDVGVRVVRPPLGSPHGWGQWRLLKKKIQINAATALGKLRDRRAKTLLRAFAHPAFRAALSKEAKVGEQIELSNLELMAAAEADEEVQKAASEAFAKIE
jgi:HEAT repeat protein